MPRFVCATCTCAIVMYQFDLMTNSIWVYEYMISIWYEYNYDWYIITWFVFVNLLNRSTLIEMIVICDHIRYWIITLDVCTYPSNVMLLPCDCTFHTHHMSGDQNRFCRSLFVTCHRMSQKGDCHNRLWYFHRLWSLKNLKSPKSYKTKPVLRFLLC